MTSEDGAMTEKRLHKVPDDFEATIRIFPPHQGGRSGPTFNRMRWNFQYAENSAGSGAELFMIYPDFLDGERNSLPGDVALEVDAELPVRMVILIDESRSQTHGGRLQVGTEFFCMEGSRAVALGRVTRITGLFTPRESDIAGILAPKAGQL